MLEEFSVYDPEKVYEWMGYTPPRTFYRGDVLLMPGDPVMFQHLLEILYENGIYKDGEYNILSGVICTTDRKYENIIKLMHDKIFQANVKAIKEDIC